MNGEHKKPVEPRTPVDAIVADRVAGMNYTEISRKYGLAVSACRYYCQKAAKAGTVTAAEIRWVSVLKNPPLADAEYNRRWLARVKRKTLIDANGCYLWQGWCTTKGYGGTTYRGRNVMIHRQVYKIVHNVELAEEEFVCHRCDVKPCWNPDHVWLGDNGLNKKDETAKGTNFWAKKTHCPRGHEYTPENTRLHESKPGVMSRTCKECTRLRMQSPEYRAKALERQQRKRQMLRAQKMGASHVQN